MLSGTGLADARQLRGAFSDTEDFLDHDLVSANRCSSRTSSITSWTENIKPSFTKKLKFQSVLEGEPVELKCKLVASPSPTILWFHNNKSIPKGRRRRICTDSKMHMHVTSLVIESIKEKDSGSYKVMAINTEGSAESTASLLVSLREEQSANYLSFARRSAKAHESIDTMAEQKKERKFRVDLRCVGSPFDKMSKVHQGRSRSKSSLVRTVYFKSDSHLKEKEPEKESKCLETASERAPSPPPMFDRSERFNDRFSDIYCDRRTGARFSDKFSDRCSDRYSERFSDTESLHNEVRTKLTTLQKAVKQKKRLSISTMSSSEFDLESVASESSYADYVEKLRVKPASLPDVQQFNRPFDSGESQREFQGKSSSRGSSHLRPRHSFEPQSRTRAIQIMRGELIETLVDKKDESFVESRANARFKQMDREHHSGVADENIEATKVELHQSEVLYSETLTAESVGARSAQEKVSLMESPRLKPVTSVSEKFLGEAVTGEDLSTIATPEPLEEECAEESLRAHYEKSLEADRMECEEKLLVLRIRKWQQGSRMSEEEMFHPETDLPMPAETQYMEPAGHAYIQQEVVEERATVETETAASSFSKSPRLRAKLADSEAAIVTTPKSPQVKARGEEVGLSASLLTATVEEKGGVAYRMQAEESTRMKARAAEVETELSPKAKASAEARIRESHSPRQVRSIKERFLSEAVTSDRMETEAGEPYEEETAGSLRAQYEKSLEAERLQCEEKLLALRIRKWQQGMQMPEEETPGPETDLAIPADTQYIQPEGHIYTQQEVDHTAISTPKSPKVKGGLERDKTSSPLLKSRMKVRPEQLESEAQKSPRIKARTAEVKAEASPRTKPRAEKMLFEKTTEERELQLSRENISELKSESEKFVSEEEALTQRIMKWQQDVQMEQEQTMKAESDWVEGHPSTQPEKVSNFGRSVTEVSAPVQQPEVVRSKKTSPGKTAKEKFLLSESVPPGFQDQQQWPPAGDLLTEGRETRLQRDSEYFVSEEEALAQRILKWQQDVVEQEEVADLESEWALANQGKRPGPESPFESYLPPFDSEPHHPVLSHEAHHSGLPHPNATHTEGALSANTPSPLRQVAGFNPSLCEPASITRLSPTYVGLPHQEGVQVESSHDLKSTPVKDRSGEEAAAVQRQSPAQVTSEPFEGYEQASAQAERPHDPSKEFPSVRRRSPCRSPQADMGGETPSGRSREEYAITDKSSSQGIQSEVREERPTGRESSEWSKQKDFAGVRTEGSRELIKSKQGGDISGGRVCTLKEDKAVQEETNLKEGVSQTQASKRVIGGDPSAGGSRPVFVKEISSVKVKVGEMSEFTCQFNGDPLPTVTWLKDGHPLAHNPDYDIISKSNKSQLTVFYPTTDHEGTYDCVITNKHGKSICSGTLEISDKKLVRTSGVTQAVVVTKEVEKQEESQEGSTEEELRTYMDSGKATLQVPQAVVHTRRSINESFSSSPVEIRITAATPVPGMAEESSEDKTEEFREKTADVSGDEGAPQTVKHKFTFSFDVVGEAPHILRELENITCSEGNTAILECIITGEPVPEVTWYYDNICLEIRSGKYRAEVDNKVYRLYINRFTYSDAGAYRCVARNKLGEVTSIADVSFQVAEPLQFSEGAVSAVDDGFTATPHSDDTGVQTKDKPLSSHVTSDVATKSPKTRAGVSREPPTISGCGLPASAAVIKVSQIKQAFESDSPVGLVMSASPEDQRKETVFPEEFIPAVAISASQEEQAMEPDTMPAEGGDGLAATMTVNPGSPKAISVKVESDFTQSIPASPQTPAVPKPASAEVPQPTSPLEEDGGICVASADTQEGADVAESRGTLQQFVEEVQESPELVRPKPQKPAGLPGQMETEEVEMKLKTVHSFDRTSSFIPFQSEKVSTVKHPAKSLAPSEAAVKPKRISEPVKPKRQGPAAPSTTVPRDTDVVGMEAASLAKGVGVEEELTEEKNLMEHEAKGPTEGYVFTPGVEHEIEEAEPPIGELTVIPEPSLDSGVFLSMPDSQADVAEVAEVAAVDIVEPQPQITGEDESIDLHAQPEPLIVKPKVDSRVKKLGLPEDVAAEGPPSQVASLKERSSLRVSLAEAGAAAPAAGSMEEEEVTFGAVYDYYNPPTDWGRPLSPESEMSIEIGSTVSEDIAEVAERFYTPGSSTEVSQPIAESFQTPKSPMSFHTPSSGTPGGFTTPQEYPFSPVEHKRPSTGDSSEMFFSPVQFLTSPADEGIETTPPGMDVDESRFLSTGRGSLSLPTLQEKVQGIPPAFLKPLIKKRVFENDSLTFYAEVFGLPSPEVKWFCNKTQLVADDRVKMERDGDSISLTIHNVTKADQGEYICEAVNYVGEARSVALVVVVSQEVRFMPAPPAVTHQHVMEFDVEEDDSSRSPSPQEILLEVELDENEVKEFEKQVKIITIPEYTADNKSMIISLDVLPSIYEEGSVDFVTQEHDDLKIAFEVTEMPPRFINPICDMETPEGTTVMFECSLMGIPSPIISWFKGDKKIPHNNKKYLHSSDGDNHFLKICKVTTQDSGAYTCRAINVVGETLCRASLVVLDGKAFSGKTRGRELTAVSLGSAKVQPQKFDMVVGNTSFDGEQVSEIELEFEFEQEADESQRSVRLVANSDNEMSEQGEKYVSINFDVFAEPAKDDKIEFKGKSSDMCSFQFQVTETPPKCVIPLTNVTAALGTPVILQCLVSGKPNPTAEWFKDGDRVTDSRCIIQEKTAGHFNLLITNVTQSDAGEYKCIIQNTAGCIETTALLKVF